jgi:hypothetical protein
MQATQANMDDGAVALGETIAALAEVLEQETRLVRAGQLGEARDLQASKAALSTRYIVAARQLRANGGQRFEPDAQTELRLRHERLQSLLQINLAVLATAHAVTESLVRGAITEVARKQEPRTYGPGGRAPQLRRGATQPVVFNRSL